jgi:hypothetical protein
MRISAARLIFPGDDGYAVACAVAMQVIAMVSLNAGYDEPHGVFPQGV